jgi:diacylglycerol kinase (ATP)
VRVTLLHNPVAGDRWRGSGGSIGVGADGRRALIGALVRAGHAVCYASTKEPGWQELVREKTDLYAVAGGDGTISKVAAAVAAETDRRAPLALVALGSANNIARSFGIPLDVERWIAGWDRARRRTLDVGIAHIDGEQRAFFESVGLGSFADLLASGEADDFQGEEKITGGLRVLARNLEHLEPRSLRLTMDGAEVREPMLLLEVMNVRFIGPMLSLADADPGDGALDVVYATDRHRAALAAWLARRRDGSASTERAPLPTLRTRRAVLRGLTSPIHIDDQVWRGKDVSSIDVGVETRPLLMLVP